MSLQSRAIHCRVGMDVPPSELVNFTKEALFAEIVANICQQPLDKPRVQLVRYPVLAEYCASLVYPLRCTRVHGPGCQLLGGSADLAAYEES